MRIAPGVGWPAVGAALAQASTSVLVGSDLPSAGPVAAAALAASALPATPLASAAPTTAVDSALADPGLLSSPATVSQPAPTEPNALVTRLLASASNPAQQLVEASAPWAKVGSAAWSHALDSFFSLDDDTLDSVLAG